MGRTALVLKGCTLASVLRCIAIKYYKYKIGHHALPRHKDIGVCHYVTSWICLSSVTVLMVWHPEPKILCTSAYPYRIHCAIDGQHYSKNSMFWLLVCSIPYPSIGHAMIRDMGNPCSLWLIRGMQISSMPCFIWPSIFWFLFPLIATSWIASCSFWFLMLELPWCTCKKPSLWT